MTNLTRTLLSAAVLFGVGAGAGLPARAQAAPDHGLQGELATLSFLVGEWSVAETHFAPDGTVVEEEVTGPMMVQPILKGSYLALVGGDGVPSVDQANLVSLLTHHEGEEIFIAHGFSAEDPDAARTEGRWRDGVLVLESDPQETASGQTMEFRVTIDPDEQDGSVDVRIDIGLDGEWFTRTEEVWTPWRRRAADEDA